MQKGGGGGGAQIALNLRTYLMEGPYCKITCTQTQIWKHTNQKSIHAMYMLSIQLLIPQQLSIHNCKSRKTTQNKYTMRMHLAAPAALDWTVTYMSDLLTGSDG